MKRVGPELKMPDLKSVKVPPVLQDLYQDLRDRRLLPLIALLLVGIVATPFLLGGGTEAEEEDVPSQGVPLEASTSSGTGRSLTVVEAQPGVRDYRKRLRHRTATNPFKPHYTGPVLAGTQLNGSPESSSSSGSSSSESSSSVTVESGSSTGSTPAPSGGAPSGSGNEGGGGGGSTGAGRLTFYAFAIDVKITKTTTDSDGKKSEEENEKQRVLPPTALPGEKTQVVTYMGISPKTKKPLLLVSEEVESVFGETDCLSGSGRCQLIEVEPKMPVTFVYGESKTRYKIVVQKIYAVPTGHS